MLSTLADVAAREGYVRPTMTDDFDLDIASGRHPVVERMMPRDKFIPNDLRLPRDARMIILTGPNMAGKSTVLRQIGLVVLMAQIGSFVPASAATIGIVDRIFTRVGASDNLVRGQSTFMVEMSETSAILHTATARSLVLLDEIGRGTATYDGVSIAWAVTEHLHEQIGCKTVFATHYHELTQLADELDSLRNYQRRRSRSRGSDPVSPSPAAGRGGSVVRHRGRPAGGTSAAGHCTSAGDARGAGGRASGGKREAGVGSDDGRRSKGTRNAKDETAGGIRAVVPDQLGLFRRG